MLQKKKILIIDDNHVDQELSKLMLEDNGFEVVVLNSATKCLDVIENELPDLVLLDIMMPDLDGSKALQLIREKYSQIEMPVIMVTSKSDVSGVVEALKQGANDYITKPVQFDIAIRRIQTHITIALQSEAMAHTTEVGAIHAMVATYNHEINNPLAVAIQILSSIKDKYSTEPKFPKIETALWRVADIVKQMNQVLEKETIEYEKYSATSRMLTLKTDKN